MATIINNPPANNQAPAPSDGGSGMGMIMGILLVVVVVFLFIVYGWPALRGNQNADSGDTGTTINIPVPDKIDVNIKK
ncbi:MAG: hypothetical protein Q8Q10_03465 [bacterium]|nr:hypothetical protein [bacterium]